MEPLSPTTDTERTRDPATLDGAVALVTGGASGIGAAVAEALVSSGARVVVADASPPPGDRTDVGFCRADVTSARDVRDLFDRMRDGPGEPDVVVVSAGMGVHERLAEGDPERWARVLDVNVMGALRVVRAFVPGMLARGRGHVVFIGSVSAGRPYPHGGVYSASKAALETVAETLRLEVQPTVRVTVVSPGIVDTPFFDRSHGHPGDVRSIGWGALEPADVAEAVVFAVTRPPGVAIDRLTVRPSAQPM